ncbi:HK97 family phage prohead protease [Methylocystis sp.]|uniref:HK97 family phage prohead protease n=1 Tax=Methylocystis sp. TaxID=1911079 RepID=UPI003DA6887D
MSRFTGDMEFKFVREAERFDLRDVGVSAPALQGYACLWKKVHWYSRLRRWEAFATGAFAASLMSGKAISAYTEHEEIGLFSTTADRLELIQDQWGLAFRVQLRKGDDHQEQLARKVAIGEWSEVSVGYRTVREHTVTIEGKTVHVLDECDLSEISICKRGAVPGTSCRLIDARGRKTLREDLRGGNLLKGAVTANAARKAACDQAFENVKASTEFMYDRLGAIVADARAAGLM